MATGVGGLVGAMLLSDEIPFPFGGQEIYRLYGGNATWTGASWSPTHPGSVSDHRDVAGLPSGLAGSGYSTNPGRFLIEGTLLGPDAAVSGVNPEF